MFPRQFSCKPLCFILLLFIGFDSFSQETRSDYKPALDNGGLVKFSLFPLIYAQIAKDHELWLTFHYENRFNNLHNSFNLTLDYMNYTFTSSLNGTVVSRVPGNIDVWVVPQWRHYFSSNPYNGHYISVFPTYLYRDHPADPRKGSYFGFGAGTGYQFRLSPRLRLELNMRLSYQIGNISTIDANQQPIIKTERFPWLALEISIGSLLRR